ncbi:RNA-processing protein PTA1 [Kluyveromyces lactis]|uniref:KLLA0A03663p n=1 Tax=Kluyveromyces lactis (strain ATCC 8585 / CBS 2359 / DSM 70799 / NBRC 1267 / NRRL Y-1140 / WM37) TaxID=284590 RepID=Q6CY28_KLULA|nr:uncharacterized protein KLLA0_A03663g [Kluyveromyces lactis]CAH02749.1 KLLA0A03663p [Kluyveromyces lactis]|eukprot:XP_451161.1 uncharacterized protein KLLA0_A03663g [Kluyveromyces lactis]
MSTSVDPLVQLQQAAAMAMQHMPEQMLPKVLETGITLFLNDKRNLGFSRFSTQLLLDILVHDKIPSSEKPFIVCQNITALWEMAETRDYVTYKNCILCLGNIYDRLFDLVAKTSDDKLWSVMLKFKELIIANWKTCYPLDLSDNDLNNHSRGTGVKLASVKLISKIIIVHTSGPGISVGSIPENHPVISNKQALEAEAKYLLDKLLTFLIEEPMMCAPWFTGALHSLSFIMKQRPLATIRIASALLKFNIDMKFQRDDEPTLQYRLAKRFVERCYRNLVQFGIKSQLLKNSGSMTQYRNKLAKISQTLFVIGEETKAKGILNYDPAAIEHKMTPADKKKYTRVKEVNDSSSDSSSGTFSATTKSPSPIQMPPIVSPMIGNTMMNTASTPPLLNNFQPQIHAPVKNIPAPPPPPPDLSVLQSLQSYAFTKSTTKHPHFLNPAHTSVDNSYSAVFALMNPVTSGFDVSKLSQDTMVKICTEALSNTNTGTAINGLSIVASRYTDLINKWLQNNAQQQSATISNDSSPVPFNNSSQSQASKRPREENSAALPIKQEVAMKNEEPLQQPADDRYVIDDSAPIQPPESKRAKIERVEDAEPSSSHTVSLGVPTLTYDEKLTHLQRIVQNILLIPTKTDVSTPMTQLQSTNPLDKVLLMNWDNKTSWVFLLSRLCSRGVSSNQDVRDIVTNAIFDYFCEDFQNRITLVLEWLSEEWYHEELISDGKDHTIYNEWSVKVLDFMIPKLDDSHRRLFIRMVSEMPLLTQEHIEKMKSLCLDPTRSVLGFQSLKFMLMFRPPVKPFIKVALESMAEVDESIKPQCDSLLNKYFS